MSISTERRGGGDDLLRPDNHELFDHVRLRILSKDPVFTMDQIAVEFGVSVDELCRWIMAYKEPRKAKAYQAPRFAPIGQPRKASAPSWVKDDDARRFIAWKRSRDGAKAAREAAT